EAGESEWETLHREVREELATERVSESVRWLTTVTAPAYGQDDGVRVRMSCYRADLTSRPRPSGEIAELGYFTSSEYNAMPAVAPAVVRLLTWLDERPAVESAQSDPKGGK
ncbi:MAG TPA: NUDIX domain-containing protein, partial [Actinopolymorphaceae bacterium]